MTEQEKDLGIFIAECVNGLPDSGDNLKDCFTLAKAIIKRFPQIKAKEADRFIRVETGSQINKYNIYSEKKVNNIYLEVKE